MRPASETFERIAYTASLATRTEVIDSILDPFRSITVRSDPALPLVPSDVAKLQVVQKKLEAYLVTKEELRNFTAESLKLQIEQHVQGGTDRKARPQLWLVIAVSSLLAIAVASLPYLHSIQQRGRVGGGLLFAALTVGGAWLFFTALPSFTSQLRRAFLIICIAVTLLGLSLLQQPVIYLLQIQSEPLVNLFYPMPILVAAILFHAGNLIYVRLLGIRNFWTSAKPVLIAGGVLSVFSWLLPHPAVIAPEPIHDLAAITWVWIMLMPMASAIVLQMAVRRLPELYKPSIRALTQSMFAIIAATAYLYVLSMFTNAYVDSPLTYVLVVLVIIMGTSLLRAGYMFNKVSKY